MVFLVNVADDVVVDDRVFAGPEVPGFLFGVVRSRLQPFELVLEVEHVVSLLVTQRSVLVLRQLLDDGLLFGLAHLRLSLRVGERLRDRVVLDFLALDELARHLAVRLRLTLQALLGRMVLRDILLPRVVVIGEAVCIIGLG